MLAMRNLNRVAEAGTCPLGQVARQASIFGTKPNAYVSGPTPKNEGWGTRKRKSPGPRDFFCCGVRLRAGRGRPGLQRPNHPSHKTRRMSTDKAKADRSSFASMETLGGTPLGKKKEGCREFTKARGGVIKPSNVATNSPGSGPKATRPELQRKRNDASSS